MLLILSLGTKATYVYIVLFRLIIITCYRDPFIYQRSYTQIPLNPRAVDIEYWNSTPMLGNPYTLGIAYVYTRRIQTWQDYIYLSICQMKIRVSPPTYY